MWVSSPSTSIGMPRLLYCVAICMALNGCARSVAPVAPEGERDASLVKAGAVSTVLRALDALHGLAAQYCRIPDTEPFCYTAKSDPEQYAAVTAHVAQIASGLSTERELVAFALSCRALGLADSVESFAYDVFFEEGFWQSLYALDRLATPAAERGLSAIEQSCVGNAGVAVWFHERRERRKRQAQAR